MILPQKVINARVLVYYVMNTEVRRALWHEEGRIVVDPIKVLLWN